MSAALALALSLAAAVAHDNSQSYSDLAVEGDRVHHELALQTLSILEVLEVDTSGDGFIDAGELLVEREALFEYVRDHYRVFANGADEPLGVELRDARVEAPANAFAFQFVTLELELVAPREIESLEIDVRLFADTSPMHVDNAELFLNGRERRRALISSLRPAEAFVVPPPWGAGDRIVQGARGTWVAEVPAALLLALCLAATRARIAVALLAAGCVLAGLALALARPEWAAGRLVALGAPLSVAYVAANALLDRKRERAPWPEAALFGLLAGLFVARELAPVLAGDPAPRAAAAAAIAGAAAVLLAAVCAATLLAGRLPHRARLGLGVMALAFGLWRFAQTAGWV